MKSVGVICAAVMVFAGMSGVGHAGALEGTRVVRAQIASSVHLPPVDAAVRDPFRAPEHAFGPGNRGIEYATDIGQSVSASADGMVVFAGAVAGNQFVTIDHGAGLVTTVGFLHEISVSGGEVVTRGQTLGAAGAKTHFSARQNGEYFDPALLFRQVVFAVRLVPTPS